MNIYLAGHPKSKEFTNHFNGSDSAAISFTSEDKQDYGKKYSVKKDNIIQIESNDDETLMIWWKEWSFLEGRNFTSSAVFKNYDLV